MRSSLASGLEQMQLQVPESRQILLVEYVVLLARWNKIHNLTAIKSPAQMITRHVLDSLSVSPFLQGQSLLDVGAGAGLPGIPLAIIHPELSVTLVDSVRKKTQFMAIAAGTLGVNNVQVRHSRVEELTDVGDFDMVTARAFTEVELLCQLTETLIRSGGRVLAMIGREPEREQMESFRRLAGYTELEIHKLCVPGEQGERNLVILTRREER